MADASTVYDVALNYRLHDKASKGLDSIATKAGMASRNTSDLGRTMKVLGAAAITGFAGRAAAKSLIGYNSQLEQAKITMAGMLQLNIGGEWADNTKKASDLVLQLQERAKKSVGTTKDMVDMASMITRPLAAAGLSMKDLENFAVGATIASRSFGIEAGMAARDIEAALMGQLRSVDRFSRALLEPLGFAGEEGRKAFNEMGAAARAETLRVALTSPAIAQMASAQETSFAGVFSTFEDQLQITLGRVGMPLFQALTSEIKKWNSSLESSGESIGKWAAEFGETLRGGFETVREVGAFFVANADTLMTMVKTFALFKVGSGAIGGVLNVANRLNDFGKAVSQAGGVFAALAGNGGGLQRFSNGIMGLLGPIGLLATALTGVWSLWKQWKDEEKKKKWTSNELNMDFRRRAKTITERKGIAEKLQDLELKRREAKRAGRSTTDIKEQRESLRGKRSDYLATLEASDREIVQKISKHSETLGRSLFLSDQAARNVALQELARKDDLFNEEAMNNLLTTLDDLYARRSQSDIESLLKPEEVPTGSTGTGRLTVPTAKVDVKVEIKEVSSPDPDRFVFGLVKAAEKATQQPTTAPSELSRSMLGIR